MKKFRTALSLVLTLVMICGMAVQAFAFDLTSKPTGVSGNGYITVVEDNTGRYEVNYDRSDGDGYIYAGYLPDGTLSYPYTTDTFKGSPSSDYPVIFYCEAGREYAQSYAFHVYQDASGQLWTDMPEYGGTPISDANEVKPAPADKTPAATPKPSTYEVDNGDETKNIYSEDGTLLARRPALDSAPFIFYCEAGRDLIIGPNPRYIASYGGHYYQDADGQFWTDMPEYGGELLKGYAYTGDRTVIKQFYGEGVELKRGLLITTIFGTGTISSGVPGQFYTVDYDNDNPSYSSHSDVDNSLLYAKYDDYIIFYNEICRDDALDRVKNLEINVNRMFYQDASGQLWTDLPELGGVQVGSADTGNATVTTSNTRTMWERYEYIQSRHRDDVVTADTTPVGFSDVPAGAWYADAVNALANTGIIQGDGQGHFLPGGTITWEQAYLIMFHLLGIDGQYLPESIDDTQAPSFATRKQIVDELLALKPVDDLSRPITRAEAIGVICLAYSISAVNFHAACRYGSSAYHAGGTSWPMDGLWGRSAEAVANGAREWAWQDTEWQPVDAVSYSSSANILACAYTIGIVHGVDEKGTLNAYADLTRAEFCQMLYNAGIFGPVYPTVYWNSNAKYLRPYLESHYIDGSLVEDYEPWIPPAMGLG